MSGRFDPADRAITTPVNHIMLTRASVFEEQGVGVAKVQHHHRIRHGGFGHVHAHLGNHQRRLDGDFFHFHIGFDKDRIGRFIGTRRMGGLFLPRRQAALVTSCEMPAPFRIKP
jgi:hypothetical protein